MARKIQPKYRRRAGKLRARRDPLLPPFAAIYINRPDETGDTLERIKMVSRLYGFCVGHGWLFSEESVYVESGGRGDKPSDRPAFFAMMSGVESGKYQYVVVSSFFEVSRDLYTLCVTVEDMTNSGCGLASILESVDTGTPVGRFVLTALAACADYYEAIKAQGGENNEISVSE